MPSSKRRQLTAYIHTSPLYAPPAAMYSSGTVQTFASPLVPVQILMQLQTLPKLRDDNWYIWKANLHTVLLQMPTAHALLFGDPTNPSPRQVIAATMRPLDTELLGIILGMCDTADTWHGVAGFIYGFPSDEGQPFWTSGCALFKHLEAVFTRHRKWDRMNIMDELNTPPTFQSPADIGRFMRGLATKARLMGEPIRPLSLGLALEMATKRGCYANIWTGINIADQKEDFELVIWSLQDEYLRQALEERRKDVQ